MSKFGNVLVALGAGMGGYAKGVQMRNEEQRRQNRDAREAEEYQFQKDQRDKARALDRDLAASQADQTIGATTDSGATYSDADLISADNRENRRNAEQLGQAAPAPVTATGYSANGQQYADQGSAQQAMFGVNSQAAKDQRAAQVMRQHGQIDRARQYEDFAKQAINEGTDKALSSILGAAPSIDALKKANGTIDGTVGPDVADTYNKTGGRWKVSPETKVQYYVDKDAAGRDVVNARVLGSDGKPMLDNVRSASLMLTDLKTRLEQQNNDTKTYQTGQQLAELSRHNQTEEGIQRRSADTAAAHLGIAQNELKLRQRQFDAGTPDGKLKAVEAALGRPLSTDEKMTALGVDKLSQTDRAQVNSLLKEQDQLSSAQAKAMADGTWQPDSPGAKSLLERNATLSLKLNSIMSRYREGAAPSADPLNILPKTTTSAQPTGNSTQPASSTPSPALGVKPAQLAVQQLDIAMNRTARAIAAAQSAGNQDEMNRLLGIFQQQQDARIAALKGA